MLDEAASVASLAGAANIKPGTPRSKRDSRGLARQVILTIERAGGGRPLGFIVAGLNPLLQRSLSYDRFHHLLSVSISQGVSNAAASYMETKRAESFAEIDRAKTAFFSNVSHEFRTPLTLMLAPIQDLMGMPGAHPSITSPSISSTAMPCDS